LADTDIQAVHGLYQLSVSSPHPLAGAG
jgi:hypothetical protein